MCCERGEFVEVRWRLLLLCGGGGLMVDTEVNRVSLERGIELLKEEISIQSRCGRDEIGEDLQHNLCGRDGIHTSMK
jgi:hypothetical protein